MVRWRPGWRWVDAIHERLEFGDNGLPAEAFLRIKDFGVAHKPKSPEEKKAAIERNARIALKELAKPDIDGKYRARLGRTVAMERKLHGPSTSAELIELLKPLTEHYRNYPEGRQAAADISRACMHLKDFDGCLEWAKKAGPSYEAVAHHVRKEYPQCIKAVQRAAGVMGRQGTHEGLLIEAGLAYLCAADAVMELFRFGERRVFRLVE
jgi:hypothetical protein